MNHNLKVYLIKKRVKKEAVKNHKIGMRRLNLVLDLLKANKVQNHLIYKNKNNHQMKIFQ